MHPLHTSRSSGKIPFNIRERIFYIRKGTLGFRLRPGLGVWTERYQLCSCKAHRGWKRPERQVPYSNFLLRLLLVVRVSVFSGRVKWG